MPPEPIFENHWDEPCDDEYSGEESCAESYLLEVWDILYWRRFLGPAENLPNGVISFLYFRNQRKVNIRWQKNCSILKFMIF